MKDMVRLLGRIPMSTGSAHLNSTTQIVSVEIIAALPLPLLSTNTPFPESAISVYTYKPLVLWHSHYTSPLKQQLHLWQCKRSGYTAIALQTDLDNICALKCEWSICTPITLTLLQQYSTSIPFFHTSNVFAQSLKYGSANEVFSLQIHFYPIWENLKHFSVEVLEKYLCSKCT